MKITINLVGCIFYPLAFYLAITGIVSWWVIVLIIISNSEYNITVKY
jgi:hypothetical protein